MVSDEVVYKGVSLFLNFLVWETAKISQCYQQFPHEMKSRAILKSQGPGIFPGYYECDRQLLLLENRRKLEPKDIPVFTRQLEILVTTLMSELQAQTFVHTDDVSPP